MGCADGSACSLRRLWFQTSVETTVKFAWRVNDVEDNSEIRDKLRPVSSTGRSHRRFSCSDAAPGGPSRSTSCCCCWLTHEMLRGASSPCRDYLTERREKRGPGRMGRRRRRRSDLRVKVLHVSWSVLVGQREAPSRCDVCAGGCRGLRIRR